MQSAISRWRWRAPGRYFWDWGKRYLDFATAAVSDSIITSTKLVAALGEQADRLCTIGLATTSAQARSPGAG